MAFGRRLGRAAVPVVFALLQAACSRIVIAPVESDGPGRAVDAEAIEDAVPRSEPRSKYGNPASYVVNGRRYYTLTTASGYQERGIASWYGTKFHGRRTSSGEPYDMYRMTAAHTRLPLPTYVQVKNLDNGRTATVKVNDRGPFHDNRIIDLSYAAALKLGMTRLGTAFVEVRAVDAQGRPTGPPLARTETRAHPAAMPAAGRPPAAAQASGLYIQVGAFQDRSNAERLSAQLGSAVADGVEIREIESNGQRFYRVQIGPIVSVDLADGVVAALEQLGIRQHRFVTN